MNEDFEPYGHLGKAGPVIGAVMAIWLFVAVVLLFFVGPWPLATWLVANMLLASIVGKAGRKG